MTVERFGQFCHWCVWPIIGLVLSGVAFWLFVIDNNAPAVTIGKVFLTLDGETPVAAVRLEDEPKVGLVDVTWHRACPDTKVEQYLQIDGHARHDVAVHPVAYPGELGPVVPKARWIAGPHETVQSMSFGQTGDAVFWMRVLTTCHWWIFSHELSPVDTNKYLVRIEPTRPSAPASTP